MELLFLFLFISLITGTESGGKLWLKLVSFSNRRGKGANNHYCDGKFFFRGSDCDHRFILCLDTLNGPQNTDTCGYGRVSTSPIHNRNSFTFGSHIGSTANPMIFSFSKWTGSCKVKVDIYDHDDNDDDYVDFMAAYFYIQRPGSNETTTDVFTRSLRHRVTLTLQLKVYCDPNYYGPGCDTICEPSDKYTCNRITGAKMCVSGWTGPDCDVKKDACSVGPCLNGGTCHNSMGSYVCVCKPGYDGNNCERNIDECESRPCSNGGTCIDLLNSYKCICPYGYSGKDCSTLNDLCIENPCLNNGKCTMDPNDVKFKCTCADGWKGNVCGTDLNECLDDICLNNGTCQNTVGGFQCFCPDGWHGDECQTDIDECLTTDCFGNSTCINTNGSYYCSCQSGFTGSLCEIDIDECISSPCLNGGLCNDKIDGFSCECAKGYSGELCKTEIDECAGQNDEHYLYINGKTADSDRDKMITDIKGVIYKYMGSHVKDISIDWSTEWLEDESGNMVSNVTFIVKLDGVKLCGNENIKALKELLRQERSGLSNRLFYGNITSYRRPKAVVERQTMANQSWLENNWYLVMVAVGLLLLVAVVVFVLQRRKRQKQRSWSNGNITNNVRWSPDLGAMNTLPSLSFDNDLYQTASSTHQASFSSEQTTGCEDHSEEQPIRSPLAFDNNTYQRAIPNEQSDFLYSNDYILDDTLH